MAKEDGGVGKLKSGAVEDDVEAVASKDVDEVEGVTLGDQLKLNSGRVLEVAGVVEVVAMGVDVDDGEVKVNGKVGADENEKGEAMGEVVVVLVLAEIDGVVVDVVAEGGLNTGGTRGGNEAIGGVVVTGGVIVVATGVAVVGEDADGAGVGEGLTTAATAGVVGGVSLVLSIMFTKKERRRKISKSNRERNAERRWDGARDGERRLTS